MRYFWLSIGAIGALGSKSDLNTPYWEGPLQFEGGVGAGCGRGKYGAKLAIRGCRMFLGIAMKGRGELACAIIGGAAGGQTVGNALGHESALLDGKIQEANGDVIFVPEGA